MSVALVVGVAFALASLAYVLYPLFAPPRSSSGEDVAGPAGRRASEPPRQVTDDEIEAAIRSYRASQSGIRACAVCGPRPEADATYCSSCGRRLSGGEGAASART